MSKLLKKKYKKHFSTDMTQCHQHKKRNYDHKLYNHYICTPIDTYSILSWQAFTL